MKGIKFIFLLLLFGEIGFSQHAFSIRTGGLLNINEAPESTNNPGFYAGVFYKNKNILPEPYFIGLGLELGADEAPSPSAYELFYSSLDIALGYDIINQEPFEIDLRLNLGLMYINSFFYPEREQDPSIPGVSLPDFISDISPNGQGELNSFTIKTGVGIDLIYNISETIDFGFDVGINFPLSDHLNPWVDGTNDSFWNFGVKLTYKFPEKFILDKTPETIAIKKKTESDEPDDFQKHGVPIVGSEITFSNNTSIIRKSSYPKLLETLSELNENPQLKIKIIAHTGSFGNKDMLKSLSVSRANEVKKWLVEKGIEESRIEAAGAGFSKPIYSNETRELSKKNERIEIIKIEK